MVLESARAGCTKEFCPRNVQLWLNGDLTVTQAFLESNDAGNTQRLLESNDETMGTISNDGIKW